MVPSRKIQLGKYQLSESIITTTIDEKSRVETAVLEEIGLYLNGIVSSSSEPPDSIVALPSVGRISHAGDEVVFPVVDNGAEVIGKALAWAFNRYCE
jgi:hypothetical protein